MPTRERLTEKLVRDAIPAEGRDYQIFDDDIRGFAVCIYRGGQRRYSNLAIELCLTLGTGAVGSSRQPR